MFVNTRNPYMFQSFLFDHPQGAVCRALCRYCNVFRWFAFVEYLLGTWPYVCIICLFVCLVLLSVADLFVNSHTQRTQISGRHHSKGTKHGIWPPEDGRI